MVEFQRTVDLDATRASAQTNLATVLLRKGRAVEAIPHFEAALRRDPENAESHSSLGMALAMAGQGNQALVHLERAVTLKPDSAEYQSNLGRFLAAAARFGEAIPHFEKAVQLSAGKDPTVLDLLAAAYAEMGRFAEAAQTLRRDPELARTLHDRLAYYESKR
jgi:Flp pilus assembly protein TadD